MHDLLLFDVDNTLTISRGKITPEMSECLKKCAQKYDIGCVSGSDLDKMTEQLQSVINHVNWKFTENGLVTFFEGQKTPYSKTTLLSYLGESRYQELVNCTLHVLSNVILPVKRGVFIELRTGLVNICPIGRSCTQEEREQFAKYDSEHSVRKHICNVLSVDFPELKFSIGGQISIDVFPKNWSTDGNCVAGDKTYCLQFISQKYDKIYFFGDNIRPGGNDWEIGTHPRVISTSVNNWKDTLDALNKMLE